MKIELLHSGWLIFAPEDIGGIPSHTSHVTGSCMFICCYGYLFSYYTEVISIAMHKLISFKQVCQVDDQSCRVDDIKLMISQLSCQVYIFVKLLHVMNCYNHNQALLWLLLPHICTHPIRLVVMESHEQDVLIWLLIGTSYSQECQCYCMCVCVIVANSLHLIVVSLVNIFMGTT